MSLWNYSEPVNVYMKAGSSEKGATKSRLSEFLLDGLFHHLEMEYCPWKVPGWRLESNDTCVKSYLETLSNSL